MRLQYDWERVILFLQQVCGAAPISTIMEELDLSYPSIKSIISRKREYLIRGDYRVLYLTSQGKNWVSPLPPAGKTREWKN